MAAIAANGAVGKRLLRLIGLGSDDRKARLVAGCAVDVRVWGVVERSCAGGSRAG